METLTFTQDSQSMAERFSGWQISNFSPSLETSLELEFTPYVDTLDISSAEDDLAGTSDQEFRQQKEAFKRIPPETLGRYDGRFVAARNGEIVDSDDDLSVLTRRFFLEHGDVPVYISKVGEPILVTIRTPLFK